MLYHVKSEQVSLAKRATRTGFVFAIMLLGPILIHRLWFAQHPLGFGETLFDAVVAAVTFVIFDSQRREYEMEVTEETISMQGGFLFRNRRVRRGRIYFLREQRGSVFREPALRLSEHGAIHRFFFGYVWIPATMPQYEEIKNKAMSWMEIG
jgi:membrane protein YdbS with pleckstrin-like domain